MTGIDRLSSALADRYRIERERGAGGMATVYLAQDLKHDRKFSGRPATCRDLRNGVMLPEQRTRGIRMVDSLGSAPSMPMNVSLVEQAYLYAKLGVPDSAFARLQRAIEEGNPYFYPAINIPGSSPSRLIPGGTPSWEK